MTATTAGAPVAAFEDAGRAAAGVQFHPEVLHTEQGQQVLEHFLFAVAGLEPSWTPASIVDEQVAAVRAQVGDKQVICALSGGVDSAVAAALVHRAVGDNLTCVFVDHGLLRKGEREQVERDYVASTGIRLKVVDASDRFLAELAGVSDPETKRKTIGRLFIRVFEDAAREVVAGEVGGSVEFLVQGTLYPDVVESGGGTGTANIKSHHNVGGLPEDLAFSLVEPLRALFKDEVRAVGSRARAAAPRWCGATRSPGRGWRSGSSARSTRERLEILREADAIAREELTAAGLDRDIWQFPVVLLADVRSRRRAGRRPHVRPSRRAASGVARGRDDRGLVAAPVRRARAHLDPHHQRGARGQPRGARRHQQATRHHRVGVAARQLRVR